MLNKNSAESEDLRSAGRHREFAMASEEMSEAEFRSFLADKSAFVAPHQCAVGGFCNRRMTSSGAARALGKTFSSPRWCARADIDPDLERAMRVLLPFIVT
jgi:hypothetical protein